MSKTRDKTQEADCPWESGTLGNSLEHARPASAEHQSAVDDAMALQMISIRLPKELIEDLKYLATREGLGYQPLVRRVLMRYASHEFKSIAQEEFRGVLRQASSKRSAPVEQEDDCMPRRAHA